MKLFGLKYYKDFDVQMQKSLDFKYFENLECANANTLDSNFCFEDLECAKRTIVWIFKILKIWHVQKTKSLNFKDFIDFAYAKTQIF